MCQQFHLKYFSQGGDPNNENGESASGDGDNKDSDGIEGVIKRINGTVDPEVNPLYV